MLCQSLKCASLYIGNGIHFLFYFSSSSKTKLYSVKCLDTKKVDLLIRGKRMKYVLYFHFVSQ